MFLELIATFAAGLGAAGLVLLLNRVTGGRLPGWAMPVAAGVAMISITIANEYGWGSRTTAGLPGGVVVVEEITRRSWYRPWTYAVPQTVQLVALDPAATQTNEAAPQVRLVTLYLFARWRPSASVGQLVSCDVGQRADVTDATLADPASATWRPAPAALVAAACTE